MRMGEGLIGYTSSSVSVPLWCEYGGRRVNDGAGQSEPEDALAIVRNNCDFVKEFLPRLRCRAQPPTSEKNNKNK